MWLNITVLLHVYVMHVFRLYFRPENIKARDVYTSISDDQLDAAITKHSDFNNRTGYRMMTAKLKSQGFFPFQFIFCSKLMNSKFILIFHT